VGQSNYIQFYNTDLFTQNNFTLQPRINLITSDTTIVYEREKNDPEKTIHLKYYQNNLHFSFSAPEFIFPERIEYAYQLGGFEDYWQYATYFKREVSYTRLKPGKYIFRLKAQMQGGNWDVKAVEYEVLIAEALWQTDLFKILLSVLIAAVVVLIFINRVRTVRRKEKQKLIHEKELLELEAKALRAQMNPHFIFNCLNSIKALIQEDEKHKATDYLTTFSKLIRTLFQNSDKRQVNLFDEVESCRLYTQLEAMRLKGRLKYNFNIDPNIDLKSVMVPALIIQPFIENAIWHGIVPKEEGAINVSIKQKKDAVVCEVDDDGIGRELSKLNKPVTPVIHESKGVHLSQARIDLEKKLNESQASIKIIDKYENDKATGTRVVITFNLN
jgi:two-component sensor histidine kinase